MTDKRRDAATATVGYGLVAGGSVVNHEGVEAARRQVGARPRLPSMAVYRARGNTRARALYLGGNLVRLAGAPAAAVGTANLVRRKPVQKADRPKSFLAEGVEGTSEAWRQKAEHATSGSPRSHLYALGWGAGAAGASSLGAHRALDHLNNSRMRAGGRLVSGRARAAIVGTASVAGGLASLPVGNRLARHVTPGYEMTPTGVKRAKRPAIRPSKRARVVDGRQLGRSDFRRQTVGKADYPGRRTSPTKQRAATMAAGAIPVIPFAGPVAAARVAAHYAPPGERRQAAGRQLGSSAATTAAAVGGAYGLAHAAEHNPWAHRQANRIAEAPGRAKAFVLGREHTPGAAKVPELVRRVGGERLFGNPRRAAGAIGGYMAGKAIVGQAAQQTAISRNLAAQRRYDQRTHEKVGVGKGAPPIPQTKQEKYRDARRRHRNAALSTAANYVGLAGVGMLAAREVGPHIKVVKPHVMPHKDTLERAGLGTAIAGGGMGSVVGLSNSRAERRRSKAETQRFALSKAQAVWFDKGLLTSKPLLRTGLAWHNGLATAASRTQPKLTLRKPPEQGLGFRAKRGVRRGVAGNFAATAANPSRLMRPLEEYAKAEPLKTYMSEQDAQRHVRRYGAAGPLPANLPREKRMQAYEARYVHSGGRKGEKWQHRATAADKVKTVGLGGATLAGAGYLVRHPTKIKSFEGAGVASATLGGAGELYAAHARRKRASYSSSPGGVAASALRRMRDNDTARA